MANKFLNVIDLSLNKIINVANGTNDNDAVNLGQLNQKVSEVVGDLSSALTYQGTFDASAGDFVALTDANQGDFYIVTTNNGPVVIDGVEYRTGDHIVINKEVIGVPVTADIDLIKNTEFPDMVFTDAEQTLTNKTIDADNNTISNLETDNLKEGVLNIDLDNSVGTDAEIPSALAVQTHVDTEVTALETKVTNLLHTEDIVGDGTAVDFVINHDLASEFPIVQVIDVVNNAIVYPAVELTDANNVTVKFGIAPAAVDGETPADTYKVIVWATNFPA